MLKVLPRLSKSKFENGKESHFVYDPSNQCDYCLEGGITLWREDWNGECYGCGFAVDENGNLTKVNREFKPAYEQKDDDSWEIVGFKD